MPGQFASARPARRRHRRAVGAARRRAHPGLRRQPRRLAGRPAHWQGRTRALEDRLSDTLHERLMQRFIDRRTSALMRGLSQRGGPMLAGVAADGAVTVEGHLVGRCIGVAFEPERGASALEDKALRAAAERAVAPEIARRLGELAGRSATRPSPCRPTARCSGAARRPARSSAASRSRRGCGCSANSAPAPARERAARRLEAFVAAEAGRRLAALAGLRGGGRRRPAARAWRAASPIGWSRPACSTAARREARAARAQPGRAARAEGSGRALRRLQPLPAGAAGAGGARLRRRLRRARRGPAGGPAATPDRPCPHRRRRAARWRLRGLRAVAGFAAPVEALERLDALRARRAQARRRLGADDEARAALGWTPGRGRDDPARPGLRARGKKRRRRAELWRRRADVGRRRRRRATPPRPSPPWRRSSSRQAPRAPRRSAAGAPRAPARLMSDGEACRIDVWLWRARFFKTRSLAARFVEEGRVRLTRGGAGESRLDKPSRRSRGDVLVFPGGAMAARCASKGWA